MQERDSWSTYLAGSGRPGGGRGDPKGPHGPGGPSGPGGAAPASTFSRGPEARHVIGPCTRLFDDKASAELPKYDGRTKGEYWRHKVTFYLISRCPELAAHLAWAEGQDEPIDNADLSGRMGEADAATGFDKRGFPTRPFYSGEPWFLPMAVGYYNLRDRWDARRG